MSEMKINALLTKVAVNLGDHGQDITTAIEPHDGETVDEFVRRVLAPPDWKGNPEPHDDWHITLRVVANEASQ